MPRQDGTGGRYCRDVNHIGEPCLVMFTALLIIDVLISISLIGLILIQHGKGADAGAGFGSGASATVFGSQGSASFLTRTTAVLAVAFFIVSLALAYLSAQGDGGGSVVDTIAPQQTAPQVQESDILPEPTSSSDVPGQPQQGAIPNDDVPGMPEQTPASDVPAP